MELPHLGKQCGIVTCKQLDFLPIHCGDCGGDFCKHHSLPDTHHCPALKKKDEEEEEEGKEKVSISRHPCQVGGCGGGELTPVLCDKCGGNFCLAHRHQSDHSCPGLTQRDNSKQQQTADHIKQLAGRMTEGKKQGRKSDQLAAKVQLMKLKQKAIGEKNIPQEDRLYLLVCLPKSSSSSSSSSSIAVFVSQQWTVGRAIDSIATLAKLENKNNILGAPKLRLFHQRTNLLIGDTDSTLADFLGHSLLNGQSVIVEYVGDDVVCLGNCGEYA